MLRALARLAQVNNPWDIQYDTSNDRLILLGGYGECGPSLPLLAP